jgi:hypothetical protein
MDVQLPRQLALEACDGWPIPNAIDADPSPGYVALAERSANAKIILAAARRLGPPTGRYNCHGLVFASRRTNIPPAQMPDAVDIDALLGHDRYAQVAPPPQVGDLVVYRGPTGIEHTGFVCRVDTLSSVGISSAVPIVFVWSMWGGARGV